MERDGVSPLVRWVLFAYTFVYGIYLGGGLFETVVVMPLWSASAESARHYNEVMHSLVDASPFFITVAPLSTLLAVTTLVVGWRTARPTRSWIRTQTISFLVIFAVTLIYFVPEQEAIKGMADSWSIAEITARANRWVVLNWIRFSLAVLLWGVLLYTLGLAFRQSVRPSRGTV